LQKRLTAYYRIKPTVYYRSYSATTFNQRPALDSIFQTMVFG